MLKLWKSINCASYFPLLWFDYHHSEGPLSVLILISYIQHSYCCSITLVTVCCVTSTVTVSSCLCCVTVIYTCNILLLLQSYYVLLLYSCYCFVTVIDVIYVLLLLLYTAMFHLCWCERGIYCYYVYYSIIIHYSDFQVNTVL